ncbi:MAG: glycosyltransferase family 4 protein [Bacteroidota bacterium]
MVCTGLGNVKRGFEMYIGSLARKLTGVYSFTSALEVWCGGAFSSQGVNTRKIFNMRRDGRLAKWLSLDTKAFLWEQRTFFLGMVPSILRNRTAVYYLGEYQLYCYLYKLRQFFGLRYSLVLYTGGQAIPGLFDPTLDYIHHVTDVYLKECAHLSKKRQTILPHFIEEDFVYDDIIQQTIRQMAGGKKIVLSVGLLDKTIKRMDLLLEALAPLSKDVFPVLLGQVSSDTAELRQIMEDRFGENGYVIHTVLHTELGNWYFAADLFVLCSPKESFGLAALEALYHGLPVICDDFAEARFVLGTHGNFIAMENVTVLTEAIRDQLLKTINDKTDRKSFVASRYTWTALQDEYLAMFRQATNLLCL